MKQSQLSAERIYDESLAQAETDDLGERRRLERKLKHFFGDTEHPTRIVLRPTKTLGRYSPEQHGCHLFPACFFREGDA